MSSAGVAVAAPQSYFCYQCNRTVTFTPRPNSDLSCPNCSGGFLEEYNNPALNNPFSFGSSTLFPDPFSLFSDPFFSRGPVVVSSTAIDLQNLRNFSAFVSSNANSNSSNPNPNPNRNHPSGFDPFEFLQNYLQNLQERGANVQFVVENHPADPNFNLPQNFGDYFLGPGLEQLIQQLAENDPNRYGTPPASKQAIDGLKNVEITDEIVNSESNSCAVCMNEFEVGGSVKQMPCKHLYHSDCLLPWLQLHNSCPVCRHELPTDDADYENRRTGGASGNESGGQGRSSEGSSGGSGARSSGGGARGFRISLPWPFRGFGGGPGGNNNDGGNSGSGGAGGAAGGGGATSDNLLETNMESLD